MLISVAADAEIDNKNLIVAYTVYQTIIASHFKTLLYDNNWYNQFYRPMF